MKTLASILLFALAATGAAAQNKTTWGTDVIVPSANARIYKDAKIGVAYDGTTYIGRIYAESLALPYQAWEIMKSTDTGRTWSQFAAGSLSGTNKCTGLDICAAGATATDFRLWIVRSFADTGSPSSGIVYLSSINAAGTSTTETLAASASTGQARGMINVAIATDSRDAQDGTNYGIAVAALKAGAPNDSVLLWVRRSAATSWVRTGVAGTSGFLRNVSVAVGSAANTVTTIGRAAVAWDDYTSATAPFGLIRAYYASQTSTGVSASLAGPFTLSTSQSYRNPSIALSQVTTGTGSSDIRTMLTYEFSSGSATELNARVSDSAITGVPGLGTLINISATANNPKNAHVMYDPTFGNFLITYHDSATQSLVYKVKGRNSPLTDPAGTVRANYRDASTSATPNIKPRVDINTTMSQAAFAWTDGVQTLFDAEYAVVSTSVETPLAIAEFNAFPNPATDIINLAFGATVSEAARYAITDAAGRQLRVGEYAIHTGANQLAIPVNGLIPGNYFITLKGAATAASVQFSVR